MPGAASSWRSVAKSRKRKARFYPLNLSSLNERHWECAPRVRPAPCCLGIRPKSARPTLQNWDRRAWQDLRFGDGAVVINELRLILAACALGLLG